MTFLLSVLVFLVSNTPRLVLNLTEVIIYNGDIYSCIFQSEYFMLILNGDVAFANLEFYKLFICVAIRKHLGLLKRIESNIKYIVLR